MAEDTAEVLSNPQAEVENGVANLKIEDEAVEGEAVEKVKKKKKKDKSEGKEAAAGEGDILQELSLKKKKKKKKLRGEGEAELEQQEEEPAQEAATEGRYAWSGTTRDYQYAELLGRLYATLTKHNPQLGGQYRKNVIAPPDIQRESVKKSCFQNFQKICQQLKREPTHFQAFFLAELSTTGNFDAEGRLVIKGRFNSSQGANVLKSYIKEYVMCEYCKSIDTLLDKDSEKRVTFLRCQRCGAARTVGAIKGGVTVKVSKQSK